MEFIEIDTVEDNTFNNYAKLPNKNDPQNSPDLAQESASEKVNNDEQSTDNQTGTKDATDASDSNRAEKSEGQNIQKQLETEEDSKGESQSSTVVVAAKPSSGQNSCETGTKIGEFEIKTEFDERIMKSIDVDKQ